MKRYLTENGGTGEVLHMGAMGVIGENGLYVPKYVIEGDPERGIEPMAPDLKSWKELNRYKDLFAVPETEPKGRWVGCPVAAWDCHDKERIENLGLDYEYVALGSEAAQWAELEGAYSRGEAIAVYAWSPHWVQAKYELVEIEMPPYSDECWASDFACAFPTDITFNAASAKFVEANPEVAEFWRNFHITNDQQAGMIFAVDVEGAELEPTVRAWMAENEDLWRAWLPK